MPPPVGSRSRTSTPPGGRGTSITAPSVARTATGALCGAAARGRPGVVSERVERPSPTGRRIDSHAVTDSPGALYSRAEDGFSVARHWRAGGAPMKHFGSGLRGGRVGPVLVGIVGLSLGALALTPVSGQAAGAPGFSADYVSTTLGGGEPFVIY